MHNDPVYETIQQKPKEVFTERSLSQATALGDQQDRAKMAERNNQKQKRVHAPSADWKREYPISEVDGTYITMNSVGISSDGTSVSTK
jgi:hypothetical protein